MNHSRSVLFHFLGLHISVEVVIIASLGANVPLSSEWCVHPHVFRP